MLSPDTFRVQCAWCGRLADTRGRYRPGPRPLLPEASHGICPRCLRDLLQQRQQSRQRLAPAA